jgi:hypothetical protein
MYVLVFLDTIIEICYHQKICCIFKKKKEKEDFTRSFVENILFKLTLSTQSSFPSLYTM